jgi:transposase InsO family protein
MREFLEQNTDTEVVLLPPKSPNLNAYMERWFRSLKSECLSRMIFFGRQSLERAVTNFVQHYRARETIRASAMHSSIQRKEAVPSLVRSSAENDSVAC